jgi:hypothetical protein
MTSLCPDDRMDSLIEDLKTNTEGLGPIDALLVEFPNDPRLLFLRGSHLVGAGRLIEGHADMARTIELAPDFAIARFQLGFLHLTSGEAPQALDTWARLDLLPDNHYLRHFVDGLRALIRDDFKTATEKLLSGMALNTDNEPMNRDMQLLLDKCAPLLADANKSEDISETSLILGQLSRRRGSFD